MLARLRLAGLAEDLGQKAFDAALDVVANWPHSINAPSCRIVELPVLVPLAREERAGVTAAHRDHDIRILDSLGCQELRLLGGDVDPHLPHRLDGDRIDLVGRRRTCGSHLDAERTRDFLREHGLATAVEFSFASEYEEDEDEETDGYLIALDAGDGDIITEEAVWAYEARSSPPSKDHLLRLLVHYLMGMDSGLPQFRTQTHLGVFPRG